MKKESSINDCTANDTKRLGIYEVTFKERGIETSEFVKARSILDAVSEFRKMFGWNEILKMERTE